MELAVGDIVHYYMMGVEYVGTVEAVHPKRKRARVQEVGSGIQMEWTRNRRGEWRDVMRVMVLCEGPGPVSLRKFREHQQRTLQTV